MKKIAIGFGIAVGVVILILALLPFAIDLNKHKGVIIDRIKTYTNRQVDFESINLTILTGLGAEIKGFRISDDPAFSPGDFLSLKDAHVKVAILPLLRKEIKIRKIELNEPQLNVMRNSAGVFNFATLLISKPGEKPKGKAPKPGAMAALLVSNVDVNHGVFTYRDDKFKPGSKPFTISDIDLESQDISLFRPISFSLSASVMSPKGQNFALAGTIGPIPGEGGLSQAPIDVHLLIDSLQLATLPIKMPVAAGTIKADISAKGTLKDKIASKAVMDLSGIILSGPEGMKAVKDQKGISCSFASDLALDLEQQRLVISSGTFTLNQDKGSFEGTVKNLKTAPVWDITLRSDRITPAPILAQLPMFAGLVPGTITLAGPAGIRLTTAGGKDAFQVNTDVDMRGMAITYGKLFAKPANSPFTFSSRMTMKKDLMEFTALDLGLGAITARGSGEVRKEQDKSRYHFLFQTNTVPLQTAQNLIPMLRTFKPKGTIEIKTAVNGATGNLALTIQALSNQLALVLSEQPKGKMVSGPMTADLAGMNLTVDALKKGKGPMSMGGTLKANQGKVINLPFKNLACTFAYGNDQFKVNSFDLAALKGSIRGLASYNLKTKSWSASPNFNGVEAASILDVLTNFKGVFAGTISGQLMAQGKAGAPALDNLGAQASLKISQGEWKNFDLAGNVLQSLLGVQGLPIVLGLAPTDVQQYQSTRFDSLTTAIDLAHKIIKVDSMQLSNVRSGKVTDTEASLKGTISMESNQLDLKGQVLLPKRFSQKLVGKTEAFTSLMDDQKRLVVPLAITGTLKKPVTSVDSRSLKNALAQYYTSRIIDKGLKKLEGKTGLPSGSNGSGKAVEDLLNGLFKKK